MWKVEYTKCFLKELSKLPKEIQVQTETKEMPSISVTKHLLQNA
jgi:mRNA-degrading endonuclease RelE of RelBE toxin-antitoxin system